MQSLAPVIAEQHQLPVATEHRLFISGNSARIEDVAANFPLEDVVEYAAETHGYSPETLSSMAIMLTETGVEAGMHTEPEVRDGAVYYPFINLRVTEKTPTWYLNAKLRHELHHPFEPNKYPLYAPRYTGVAIRTVGLLACAGDAYNYFASHGVLIPGESGLNIGLNDVAVSALGAIAAGATVGGANAAYIFSKSERIANVCAYKNRAFKPISQ
jgi:hypothetical protein